MEFNPKPGLEQILYYIGGLIINVKMLILDYDFFHF